MFFLDIWKCRVLDEFIRCKLNLQVNITDHGSNDFLLYSLHGSDVTNHSSLGRTTCEYSLQLLCWPCVLHHTNPACQHFMLILPLQFNSLCHPFRVCTRNWKFYLQHHNGILTRWPHPRCEYHSCWHRQVDHAWKVFSRVIYQELFVMDWSASASEVW